MKKSVVLGLDLGTSGVRVVAVNLEGKLVAQSSRSYMLHTPYPGWTEQNPEDWIVASIAVLQEICLKLESFEIAALGLSGQMHGMTALDRSGAVIRPAILWNDQRTGDVVVELESKIPRQDWIQRTGNRAATGFQLPKLLWLRDQEPQAFDRIYSVLLPKDYLGFVLTGNQVTEPSDASGVGCFNLRDRQWDTEILSALGLSSDLFPNIVASTDIVGYLTSDITKLTGLPQGLPVIAGGGDNAAAAIGLGILSNHTTRGSLSLGTSGVILAPLTQPTPEPEGRVHLFCHVDGGYHLLGVTLSAAGSLRWVREVVAPELTYDQLSDLAATAPIGSNDLLFLPHLSGERSPYFDSTARGAWIGLSLAHQRSHLVRAVLEGVAFSLRAAFEVMQPLTELEELITTGGGANSSIWRQILADVLQTRLVQPTAVEGAAYGAALVAMLGIRLCSDFDAVIEKVSPVKAKVEPNFDQQYEEGFANFQKVYRSLKLTR